MTINNFRNMPANHLFLMLILSLLALPGCAQDPQVDVFAISDIYSLTTDGGFRELTDSKPGRLALVNQHWDHEKQLIKMAGAANEEVAVQLVITDSGKFTLQLSGFDGPAKIGQERITTGMIAFVKHEEAGMVADLVMPSGRALQRFGDLTIPQSETGLPRANNRAGAFLVEVWIPEDAPAGLYRSTATIFKNGKNFRSLTVDLTVYDFRLPDQPSLAFEILSYGMPSKAVDRSAALNRNVNGNIAARPLSPQLLSFNHQVFKLALDNRCFINPLPYSSQRGNADFALPVSGRGKDAQISGFEAWEQLYEPLLSGNLSKFGSVPGHVFLPFNINYPYLSESEPQDQFDFTPYKDNISEKPGQTPALTEFEETYKTIAQQYRAYLGGKGWTVPRYEVFYNQKANPDRNRSPWKLDEPVQESDYRGLRYLFNLSRAAFAPWREDGLTIVNRVDIGHFNCDKLQTADGAVATCYKEKGFNRDHADRYLKSLVDHWVIGTTHAEAADQLFDDYRHQNTKMINYSTSGSAAGIAGHYGQFAGEGFRALRLGLDGRVIFKLGLAYGDPNQVSADPYRGPALYHGKYLNMQGALPSRRLKLWRRSVNDYEYLQLAQQKDPALVKQLTDKMITAGESHDPKYAERSNLRGYWLNNNIEDYSRARQILAAIIAGQPVSVELQGPDSDYIPCQSGDRIGGYD